MLSKAAQCMIALKYHKFWIELPKMVEEAVAINNKSGNSYWQDFISKEIENVKVAFQILFKHPMVTSLSTAI